MTIYETFGETYEDELYEGEFGAGEGEEEFGDQESPLLSALGEAGFAGEVYELSDESEAELAMELLEVTSEEELDQFLGKLVRKVASGAKALVKSPIGKALGGVLKNVAKTALPMVGSAIGSFVAPGVGTAIGGKLGSMASKLLEAEEAEMMGEEEAQFEAARRYVRWASGTVRNVARAPRSAPPSRVLRSAAISSARQYAPALLGSSSGYGRRPSPWRRRRGPGWGQYDAWGTPGWTSEPDASGAPVCRCGAHQSMPSWDPGSYADEAEAPPATVAGRSGRWVRRGNRVVLLDVG